MISDVKHMGKFHVDFLRVVLDLPHQEIAEHTIKFVDEECPRYTTYHNHELNEKWKATLPHRKELEADLINMGREFTKRTPRKEFPEGEEPFLFYWASVYRKGDQHGSHIHPNSLIAGTYYPQVGPASESITYEAPWTHCMMHESLPFESSLFSYKPNVGDCMLWPSWISHRVSPQKESDIDRVAISFNLDYKKYHG